MATQETPKKAIVVRWSLLRGRSFNEIPTGLKRVLSLDSSEMAVYTDLNVTVLILYILYLQKKTITDRKPKRICFKEKDNLNFSILSRGVSFILCRVFRWTLWKKRETDVIESVIMIIFYTICYVKSNRPNGGGKGICMILQVAEEIRVRVN